MSRLHSGRLHSHCPWLEDGLGFPGARRLEAAAHSALIRLLITCSLQVARGCSSPGVRLLDAVRQLGLLHAIPMASD